MRIYTGSQNLGVTKILERLDSAQPETVPAIMTTWQTRFFVSFLFFSFVRLFFVRGLKICRIGRVDAIHLVRKSAKSELSLQFFGRSKIKIKKHIIFLSAVL